MIGTIAPRTGIEPFIDLVHKVMTTEAHASERRVFWVVDNGSSHNGARTIERMEQVWPTATLVHLPVHASWLNQGETYFSILRREAIAAGHFAGHGWPHRPDTGAFQHRYNDCRRRSYRTSTTPLWW